MRPASKWVVIAIAAIAGVPAAAQRFETGATAVVVDVVVRDKAGRFVTGLTPADLTVTEDGVAQRITSLQLVGTPGEGRSTGPAEAVPSAPAAARGGVTSPEQPRFTALVFGRVEGANARIARVGGEAAIVNAGRADVVGIFLVDHGLRIIQPFTADKAALTAGVARAVERAVASIVRDDKGRRTDLGETPPPVASAEFSGQMVQVWNRLDLQYHGHEITDALLMAAATLSTLPGRKTLLYYTDAMPIPDDVLAKFNDVVATANRGQVTIYAIDTAGLRLGSQEAATRDQVAEMARKGVEVTSDGGNSSDLRMMERNEGLLRSQPHVGLTMLAKPTGGFLIENTNNLAAGVRRIEEDRRVHYLLTYAPARTELDGKWRAIDVKVNKKNVTVQARQGYVAVRSPGVLPVLVYEGPALAAIDRTPAPREIPARAGAFAFPRVAAPEPGKAIGDDVAVVVMAPAAPLTFEVKGASYGTDFTMLALLRDQDGEPFHKTSQPFRLQGPAASRDTAMKSEVRFSRTLATPPGSYTVWGSVHDAKSGRAGVAERRLTVADRGPTGLGVSSLVLLGRLERATAPAPDDPLVVDGRLITPNLGEPMFKTPEARLGFYFLVVGADPGERLQARLQFYQDGIPEPKPVLLDAPLPLEPADARGVVRPLGALPLKDLPVGSLEARLILERSGRQDIRSAFFRLEAPRPTPTPLVPERGR
jgi:VWFA-related protein